MLFRSVAPETDLAGAMALAERLRIAIETEFAFEQPALTASFGIAVHRPGGLGFRDLFDAADRAMYAAKEAGRNRVELAAPSARRFQPVAELDEVVERSWVGERVA